MTYTPTRDPHLRAAHVQSQNMARREPLHPKDVLLGETKTNVEDIISRTHAGCLGDQTRHCLASLVDCLCVPPVTEV